VNGNSDDEESDDAQLLLDMLDIFEGGRNVSQKDKPYSLHFQEEVRMKKNGKQTMDYHGMFTSQYFKGWFQNL